VAAAHPGKDRLLGGTGLDPFEAASLAVELVKRRVGAVEAVEIAHQGLHAGVAALVEQVPVEAAAVAPLVDLRELLPHEQQLFAWMAPHESEVGAQVSEALGLAARHLGQAARAALSPASTRASVGRSLARLTMSAQKTGSAFQMSRA
jgi:hypothetical protein